MPGPASLFREIHRLRRFARDLEEQINRIPRQRKAYQTKLATREKTLKDEQDAIKKLKVLASEKEKELKGKGEQIERYERQQTEITSKKEYDALRIEIAHAREVCAKLEDEILQSICDYEERQARLPEVEKAVALVKEEVARFEAEASPRKTDLDAQLAQTLKQLKEIEAQVPRDLKAQYDRTVASMGADGFSLVKNRSCSECNTEIIRSMELNLLNEECVVCKSCGRLLYLPEMVPVAEDE